MVARYRPSFPAPRFESGVGQASIRPSTIKRAEREGKKLRERLSQPSTQVTDGVRTTDAFQNFGLNIGLGTNNALSQSQYGFFPITRIRTLLDWIHRGSWLGGMAIDLLADDMTRGGIEILTVEDPSDVEKMQQGLTRLQIWSKLASTIKWANLYGGCIAVFLIDGQDPATPLRIETVGRNQFKGLLVLDRWMIDPDLNHLVPDYGPNVGLPMYYRVVADAPAMRGQKIHYTRCIRLEGIELPYWQRIMENLWGLSVFERLYDRMIAFDSATMGAAQLVYKAYVRTYKIDGLHEAATAGGDALVGIAKRVELMRKWQGIEGMTLLDKLDDFAAHETSGFTGIADVLVHFAEQLSGALQIPLVRLMGQSPAGLNSTGESDLRTYYDNILQRQEKSLRDGMNSVLRILGRSLGINLEDNFNFNFNPLWQLNEDEKSTVADRDTRMVLEAEAAGLISAQVALREMRQGSRVTGRWTNINDKMIDAAPDVVEPPAPEGAMSPEGGEEGPRMAEQGAGGPSALPAGERPSPEREPAESPLPGLEKFHQIRRAVGGEDRRALDQYQLPFTEIGGLQVVIEFYPGTIRRGEGWSTILPCAYGYIRRIGSAEGPEEWLDALVGGHTSSRDVWVIDSVTPEGEWDEHKICLAFDSKREALNAFRQMYGDYRRVGALTHFSMNEVRWKDWLHHGDKTKPLDHLQVVA